MHCQMLSRAVYVFVVLSCQLQIIHFQSVCFKNCETHHILLWLTVAILPVYFNDMLDSRYKLEAA